jgi:hypothetical protein
MVYLKYTMGNNYMQFYSENQIRTFYTEFRGHKKYTDKLAFFDQLFGIIPFSFPEFDPQLGFFFQPEKTDELSAIFKKERNNPGLTERKFSFGENMVFNIKPANSNSSVYSNYILSIFISRAPVFDEWIRKNVPIEKPVEFLLNEANGYINRIEYCLQNEYDKSFRLQCMSVFYKGYYDAFCMRVNLPDKKRKFTELYLYAQGITYSNYISFLKTSIKKSFNRLVPQKPAVLDLPAKLNLLKELGVIDFLKTRFNGFNPHSTEQELAEIICQITGENREHKPSILSFCNETVKGIRRR